MILLQTFRGGYTLLTPEEGQAQLELYFDVQVHDLTADFSRWLEAETGRIEEAYGNGSKDKSAEEANELLKSLRSTIEKSIMAVVQDQAAVVAKDAAAAAVEQVAKHLDAEAKEAHRKK